MLQFYSNLSRRQQTRLSVYVMAIIVLLLSAIWTLDRIRILLNIREMMEQNSRY